MPLADQQCCRSPVRPESFPVHEEFGIEFSRSQASSTFLTVAWSTPSSFVASGIEGCPVTPALFRAENFALLVGTRGAIQFENGGRGGKEASIFTARLTSLRLTMTYGALPTADQRQWPAQQNVSNLCVSYLKCVTYPRNALQGQAASLFDIKCQEMSGNQLRFSA
jgi:hypothetical protein